MPYPLLILRLIALGCLAFCAMAAKAEQSTYRVSRDGVKIGEYRFTMEERGGERALSAEMDLRVRLLFLTVYRATHKRVDIWRENRLISSDGTSRYQGVEHSFTFRLADGRARLKADDDAYELVGPVVTLVPWRLAPAGTATLITEKGKRHEFTIAFERRETLPLLGRQVTADKYRLSGRRASEVWYDPAGVMLKLRYEQRGAVIDIEREWPAEKP